MNVDRIASTHKGHATWTFSQSDLLVWRHYRTFGICAALSAEWIRYHAHDGSLANVLGGGGVGPLNVGKLKEIALLHKTASDVPGSQRRESELCVQMHDVLSLNASGNKTFFNSRTQQDQTTASAVPAAIQQGGGAPNIENDIVAAMQRFNSCYVRINFGGTAWGTSTGHAVAAWLGQPTYGGAGDALFFDPNYGEYWFEQKANFFRFFPVFYRAAYRSFPLYFDQDWEVLPCAKRV